MKSYLEIDQLDEHSWVISEGKGNGRTHCYLLEGENKAILIDTGLGLVNMKKIVKSLTDKHVQIINTHGHLDHISKNYQFDKAFIHSNDHDLVKLHLNHELRYEFHKSRYLRKQFPKWLVNSYFFKQYLRPLWYIPKACKFEFIDSQQTIDLGNRCLKIIETPGHTQGCICILDTSRNWLFTGDMICEKGVLLNLEESTSINIFLKSMEILKEISPSVYALYPGHQKYPLEISYIKDYIDCANEIIQNKLCVQTYQYKKATISFKDIGE